MTDPAERETVLTLDPVAQTWTAWTADPSVAKAWKRLRWPVEVFGSTKDNSPRSWQIAGLPSESVILRPAPRKKP